MLDHVSTRRLFLQKGLTVLAASATIPTFLDQTVLALDDPADTSRTQKPSGKDGKILVVVQLAGGNDGLNMVVPYGDDAYYRARPQLGIPARDLIKLNDYLGLHPNLAALRPLIEKDRLGIVQGVGYPNPNRSHFRSMDIWQTAVPDKENVTTGWVGRYFDNTCTGADPHVGVSIGETLPLAMQGARITPLAFEKPENYRYNGPDRDGYLELNRTDLPGHEPEPVKSTAAKKPAKSPLVTPQSQLDFIHRTAMDAQVSSDNILRITRGYQPAGEYPGGEFGDSLRTVAAMIGGGLPTRVYYVSLGGFDTHANQRGRHDGLMQQLAAGVAAFWQDMLRQENTQRVLMMCFSEFGRRVQQNASGGTDHGAAAPMMLLGESLKSPLVGAHPSLTKLDAGDLIHTVDFRSVYAAILQDWLDTPSKPILGQQFPVAPILKT